MRIKYLTKLSNVFYKLSSQEDSDEKNGLERFLSRVEPLIKNKDDSTPKEVKKLWNLGADHSFFKKLTKIHWLNNIDSLKYFKSASGRDELSVSLYLPDSKLNPPSSWVDPGIGLQLEGRITLACNDMGSLFSGYASEIKPEVETSGASRRGQMMYFSALQDYILDADSFDSSSTNNEGIIDNWKIKSIVLTDVGSFNEDLVDFVLNLRKDSGPLSTVPILDQNLNPIDFTSKQDTEEDSDELSAVSYLSSVFKVANNFYSLAGMKTSLPENWVLELEGNGQEFTFRINSDLGRMVAFLHMERADDPSLGSVWEVDNSIADQGYGPFIYDLAMEFASKYLGDLGLMPDRTSLTGEAKKIWEVYSNRSDVGNGSLPEDWFLDGKLSEREDYLRKYYYKNNSEFLDKIIASGQMRSKSISF